MKAIPAINPPPQTRKLHADKAYDHTDLRTWVRDRGIIVRIARKGIETSENSADTAGWSNERCAPRGALLYPRFSREELGGRFLGRMAYLDAER